MAKKAGRARVNHAADPVSVIETEEIGRLKIVRDTVIHYGPRERIELKKGSLVKSERIAGIVRALAHPCAYEDLEASEDNE